MKNETKVICPKCGSEIAIPEHSSLCTGVSIGKDSNLGTIVLPLAKSKASDRIEALKKAGIDTSSMFALPGDSGIVRMRGGKLEEIKDDDPIFKAIIKNGSVPNRDLFRRWVMAQMFAMLEFKSSYYGSGYTQALKMKGYEYSWKMIIEELRVQNRMVQHGDIKGYTERYRWFNKNTCYQMANEYIYELKKYIDSLKTKKLKKKLEYKRIHGKDYFVEDIHRQVIEPVARLLCNIKNASSANELYRAMVTFNNRRIKLNRYTTMPRFWVDAYKGSGSYYTLQNLIRFHGVCLYDDNLGRLTKDQSEQLLEAKAEEYKNEGWRLLGLLKKTLVDNHIDIEAKRAEWRRR